MGYNYSIIIPHYRIPKLLRRCLWSVPKRDDLQVLVVDDNSGSDIVAQLREIEKDFPFVTFIYSETNGGGGRARNIGLQHAQGKYVLFADADDFYNYSINNILNEYINTDFDIVFFRANHIDTDTYLPTNRGTTQEDAVKQFLKTGDVAFLKYMYGEPWGKLIRRGMLIDNNITFDETLIHNDTKFSYLSGYFANKVKFDNRALYCLADRPISVSKQLSDEKLMVRTQVFAEKNRFLIDHGIDIFDTMMLKPFKYYLQKWDWEHLDYYFSVTSSYGFSKLWIVMKAVFLRIITIRKYLFFNIEKLLKKP